MFRIISLAAIAIIASVAIVSATIIHIPDDYSRIQQGIDASSDGDTVLVQPGIYEEIIDFGGHNIVIGSLYITTGDTSYISQTQIDGNNLGSVVTFQNGETRSAELTGFMLMNGQATFGGGIFCSGADPTISHNIIKNNSAFSDDDGKGGGVFCAYSNMLLKYNVIKNNYCSGPEGGYGGGLYCENFAPVIKGNLIINNLGDWAGGGIYFKDCNAVFSQNVVAKNTATVYGGAMLCDNSNTVIRNVVCYDNESSWAYGGGFFCYASYPIIVNSIFWGDSAFGSPGEFDIESGDITVNFSDIQGGWYEGEGILDAEPHFRAPANSDFHLMALDCGDSFDSPCIDMGRPDILDSLLDCDHGLGTLISDMGAYGGWDSIGIGIDDPQNQFPDRYALSQNYPNPFNASTAFEYQLPRNSQVKFVIYDVLGKQVAILRDGLQTAGHHQVIWRADDLASGIYLYRLQAEDFIETRRMVIVK